MNPLRMPIDGQEAERVFSTYDGQNGRYYILADVVFVDGEFLPDVVFHADMGIAASLGSSHEAIPSRFWGRELQESLVIRNRTGGSEEKREATSSERQAFRDRHKR